MTLTLNASSRLRRRRGAPGDPLRRAVVFGAFALVPLLLSGCAALLPKPPVPPRFHLLDPPPAPTSAPASATSARPSAGPATLTLVVNPTRAAPGYDSTRLLYQRQPRQLAYFAYNEWVDTPAHMLAPLLVTALQRGGHWRAVVAAPSAASGDVRLETTLLRLHQDFSVTPDQTPGKLPSQVRFTLRATLVDSASHRVLAWREFDTTEPAPGNDPDSGVAAANRAVQRVLVDLGGFCADAADRSPAP